MQSIKIAFRNVSRQRKRSLLLGGAIAFGFFVFTVVNGFTGGLLETVKGNIESILGGDIYVSGSEVSDQGSEILVISDSKTLSAALGVLGDQVSSYNARSSADARLVFGSAEEFQTLVGIDVDREKDVLENLTFVEGSAQAFLANDKAVLLPAEMVDDLGVAVGESVIVKTTTITGQENVGDFVVVGSFQVQNELGFAAGYAHIGTLNTLLDMSADQYQALNLYLKDLSQLEPATTALHSELERLGEVKPRDLEGGQAFGLTGASIDENERWSGTKFEVTNLNDVASEVTTLVNVLKRAALVIFLIIIAIIMVGIMNSYRMVMLERTAEIGTMRALGFQKAGIRNIFIWEALFIALGGALAGIVVALLVMGGVRLVAFSPSDFSFFLNQGRLQFTVTGLETLGYILLLCLLSVAAVYLPARAAANLKPAEALRAS